MEPDSQLGHLLHPFGPDQGTLALRRCAAPDRLPARCALGGASWGLLERSEKGLDSFQKSELVPRQSITLLSRVAPARDPADISGLGSRGDAGQDRRPEGREVN